MWRSRNIALVLIGSSAALAGFSALEHEGDDSATTQPTTRTSGSGHHWWHSGSSWTAHGSGFAAGTGGGSSGGSSGKSSGHASGTSHGGFGSTGHAAGS